MLLTISVSSPAGCRLSATDAGPKLTVASGPDRVWNSANCPVVTAATAATAPIPALAPPPAGASNGDGRALLLPAALTVAPGDTGRLSLVWPGVRLASGCHPAAPALRPGTYTAAVRLTGLPTARTVFVLR